MSCFSGPHSLEGLIGLHIKLHLRFITSNTQCRKSRRIFMGKGRKGQMYIFLSLFRESTDTSSPYANCMDMCEMSFPGNPTWVLESKVFRESWLHTSWWPSLAPNQAPGAHHESLFTLDMLTTWFILTHCFGHRK